ncbi:MAG TPA: GGDEF domain-containing response regulator [Methylibium sp.]|nr:GGDEF domain-containing response regulator [Methylibium sp.]
MTAPTPYVLLVEDHPGDAGLVQLMFEEAAPGSLPELVWETSARAGADRLLARPGCSGVLLDLNLPDSQGLEALGTLLEHAHDVPIVVLSGNDDEAVGLAAVVGGAQDYMVKGQFDGGQLRRALQYAAHRKRVEAELIARAMHDALTGLPTRTLLLDRLRMALGAAARSGGRGALLFVDLDRFKQVNDGYGHPAGDAVLRAAAARMTGAVRAIDTVARVGGDEFVVLLPVLAAGEDAELVAHKLLQALDAPVPVGAEQIRVGASIGVACFGPETVTSAAIDPAETLIARADVAMYEAKGAGRSTVRAA